MTTDPSSSVAQTRKELGARLRQLRKAVGLTGQAVADATGQHFTRISRIENGVHPPTEANFRAWCVVCNAEDQIGELLATAAERFVEAVWQRLCPAEGSRRSSSRTSC